MPLSRRLLKQCDRQLLQMAAQGQTQEHSQQPAVQRVVQRLASRDSVQRAPQQPDAE
jgi:hypothetical protein